MDRQFSLLVDLVKADGLGKLSLRANSTRVSLLVHPFDGEWVDPRKPANLPHFTHHALITDGGVKVGDENLPEKNKRSPLGIEKCQISEKFDFFWLDPRKPANLPQFARHIIWKHLSGKNPIM